MLIILLHKLGKKPFPKTVNTELNPVSYLMNIIETLNLVRSSRLIQVLNDFYSFERMFYNCKDLFGFTESSKIENSSRSEVSSDNEDFDIDSDEDLCSQPEKYLIFATGSNTAITPHQIGNFFCLYFFLKVNFLYSLFSINFVGIKRIGRVTFPKKLDPGPSLAERIAERKERAQRPPVAIEDINIDNLSKNFDSLDHLIELHGHIIGMKLSPDHR